MMTRLIMRYWHGEGPLWRVFWVYGVAASIAAGLPIAILAGNGRISPTVTAFAIGFGLLYTIWILVSVWRCAFNVRGRTLGQPPEFWGLLARALTIGWAINFVGLSAMLLSANAEFYVGA
jgi:hypothetical protein